MNVNTGEIRNMSQAEFEYMQANEIGDWTPLNLNYATDKQKEEMQVSKHDNNSKLGKQFTGNRRQRREQQRAFNKSLKRKHANP